MAINYTQAFNAGEVSRKMDGRNDLEVYKTGCRDLDNFFVLPQGGVERRAGTEFVQLAGSGSTPDGANPARMIEFDFSSDVFYVIELGTSYAKVHYTDDNGVDQVVNVTGTVPAYTQSELRLLQFNRRYDTLILTCPTKETQVFKRTQINPNPAFSIEEITYDYPPLMEQNVSSTELSFSNNTGGIFNGIWTITSSADLFFPEHVGAYWGINHLRSAEHKEIAGTRTTPSNDANSNTLDASFTNWSFETDGIWKGSVVIQRNLADGNGFVDYVAIGDTSEGVARNFSYASQEPEPKNSLLRVKWVLASSSQQSNPEFKFSIRTESSYHKGVVKILTRTSATQVTARIISHLQGGNRATDNTTQTPTSTVHWSEGAFSEYRGFSPASEFFENRLWLAGSKDEPADIFGSKFNHIYNFSQGDETNILSTDAIKRTIDSPEEPKWLEGKRYLFLGTAGTAVSIRSADRDSLISQRNITTLIENAYGSAALQAEIANDVVVYVQRDGLKVRELVFDQNQDTYVGNDLNLLSEDVTDSGIVEMFVQKEPNQVIWCIKENGDACAMTYERGQQVRGWSRINTDGKFFSAAAIHDSGEDVVWACVNRGSSQVINVNGNFINNADGWSAVALDEGDTPQSVLATGSIRLLCTDDSRQQIRRLDALTVGHEYEITYTISSRDVGSIRLQTENGMIDIPSEEGTHTLKFKPKNHSLQFRNKYRQQCDVTISSIVVKDLTAAATDKYCIEKFRLRKDLNWYVDSGKEFKSSGEKTVNATNPVATDYINFNLTDHGYNTDDFVELDNYITGSSSTYLEEEYNGKRYKVHRVDANNFNLKSIDTNNKLSLTSFTANSNTYWLRTGDGSINDPTSRYSVDAPSEFRVIDDNGTLKWGIYGSGTLTTKSTTSATYPWEATYESLGGTPVSFTFGDGIASANTTVKIIGNTVSGLSHLEDKEVQVVVDGSFVGTQVVSGGAVSVDDYGESIVVGLPYTSTLVPMPIEPQLYQKLSQSRVKAVSQMVVRFFKTKGAAVGEKGKQLTTYSVLDTQDSMGKELDLKTGQQRFFTASTYEREKLIEVRQDLPYPMTVLSIATHINAEGA